MTENVNLLASWGVCTRTVDQCAERVLDCLRKLAVCDAVFAQTWLQCGNSLKSAYENKVELTVNVLRQLLDKGRFRRDVDKTVMEELGFSSGRLWNGSFDTPAHVAFHCGAHPDPIYMPGVNSVRVEFPPLGPAAERTLQMNTLRHVMSAVVSVWDPDWARVSTYEMDQVVYPEAYYKGQKAGWLTYASDRYGELPELPPTCGTQHLEGLGTLIVLNGIKRVSSSGIQHVKAVRSLSEVLKKAGMLAPLPPLQAGP
jgi:hypothetical protein